MDNKHNKYIYILFSDTRRLGDSPDPVIKIISFNKEKVLNEFNKFRNNLLSTYKDKIKSEADKNDPNYAIWTDWEDHIEILADKYVYEYFIKCFPIDEMI
jgi:hypothetical protein